MKYILTFLTCSFLLVSDYEKVELRVYKGKLTKKNSFKEETVLTFRTPEDSMHILLNNNVIKRMKLTRMDVDEAWYDEWCKEYYRISNNKYTSNDTLEIRFLTLKKKFLIPIDKHYANIDLFYTEPLNEHSIRNAILNYTNSRWIVE